MDEKSVMDQLMEALAGFLASHDEVVASGHVCNCECCIDGRVAFAKARAAKKES